MEGKKAGRKKGSRNKSVTSSAIKDPYVYGALKILEQARIDYEDGIKYGADGKKCKDCIDSMWEEWLETETCKEGITRANRFTIASAIGSYVEVKDG